MQLSQVLITVAAVIGREFRPNVLQRVAGASGGSSDIPAHSRSQWCRHQATRALG